MYVWCTEGCHLPRQMFVLSSPVSTNSVLCPASSQNNQSATKVFAFSWIDTSSMFGLLQNLISIERSTLSLPPARSLFPSDFKCIDLSIMLSPIHLSPTHPPIYLDLDKTTNFEFWVFLDISLLSMQAFWAQIWEARCIFSTCDRATRIGRNTFVYTQPPFCKTATATCLRATSQNTFCNLEKYILQKAFGAATASSSRATSQKRVAWACAASSYPVCLLSNLLPCLLASLLPSLLEMMLPTLHCLIV